MNSVSYTKVRSPLYQFAEDLINSVGILDEETAEALIKGFGSVSRADLMGKELGEFLLADVALPIDYGRYIPRPSYIARMLGLIGIRRGMRILEIGCGAGYCSAVMAQIGAYVFATEEIGLLAQQTRKHLDSLGYQNVLINMSPASDGWAEYAPYDAVVVMQPMQQVVPELLSQLIVPGGQLVVPLEQGQEHRLCLWETNSDAPASCYQLEKVNFQG